MPSYKLSPFAAFVESRLFEAAPQYAVFHRLTGHLLEPLPPVGALLQAAKIGTPLSLDPDELNKLGEPGYQVLKLIEWELLIPPADDPWASFVNHYVNRPIQNPAISYKDGTGKVFVVSISMAELVYSPETGKLPEVIEETFPELVTKVLLAADGTKTLREIHSTVRRDSESPLDNREFVDAIEFLTKPARQLIKFAPTIEGFADPFYPANLIPRNLYHAARWAVREPDKSIGDFHLEGIDDALWEFDIIEPTVNHGLRFPTQLLSGKDYGTSFCDAVFENVSDAVKAGGHVEILEVGGGTGTFARSFIKQAQTKIESLSYQIMDLSPALAESQRRILTGIQPAVGYVSQDATKLSLRGRSFDLIVSNEVIADFSIAVAERHSDNQNTAQFTGDGAIYIDKYSLDCADAPERFFVNSGVFEFLERAWSHLNPGGVLVLSEYGAISHYPAESFHLNHSEYSIHFGHVAQCARKIGFECRLELLTEFLGIDEECPVLVGREEHICCLNYIFERRGRTLPFGLFSKADFENQFGDLAASLSLDPIRFLPLRNKFHYGPNLGDFFVVTLRKPGV
jgi:phospholipid N-methyltransferase